MTSEFRPKALSRASAVPRATTACVTLCVWMRPCSALSLRCGPASLRSGLLDCSSAVYLSQPSCNQCRLHLTNCIAVSSQHSCSQCCLQLTNCTSVSAKCKQQQHPCKLCLVPHTDVMLCAAHQEHQCCYVNNSQLTERRKEKEIPNLSVSIKRKAW